MDAKNRELHSIKGQYDILCRHMSEAHNDGVFFINYKKYFNSLHEVVVNVLTDKGYTIDEDAGEIRWYE